MSFHRILIFIFLFSMPGALECAEISGPDVRSAEGDIFVSTALALDSPQAEDIEHGIKKEMVFHVGLYRVWRNWPDEYVLGKSSTRTLKCDPVKKEYTATSFDGATYIKKRFPECKPLMDWALGIRDLRLANTKELDPASYYVKVTVESRLMRLPPVISFLFFFVPEKEYTMHKNSKVFSVGDAR